MALPLTPYSGVVPQLLTQTQPQFDSANQDFVDFITEFPDEFNQAIADLGTANTNSTSVTSLSVGTGSKALTVDTGKAYFEGQSVTIARTSAPNNRMFCVVHSYNSGTGALVVTSQAFEGSGTFTDWTITLGFNGVISIGQLSVEARGVGELFDWPVASTPSYGLLCNGAEVSRTTYAALFAVIGTTWGAGDGSTTFNIPNIPANYTTVQANGNEGTSTTGEVKAHNHTQTSGNAGNAGGTTPPTARATPAGSGWNTGTTGGSANLAAGVCVRKCIRF